MAAGRGPAGFGSVRIEAIVEQLKLTVRQLAQSNLRVPSRRCLQVSSAA